MPSPHSNHKPHDCDTDVLTIVKLCCPLNFLMGEKKKIAFKLVTLRHQPMCSTLEASVVLPLILCTCGTGIHHSGPWQFVLQIKHRLAHLCRRGILGFVAFIKNNLRRGECRSRANDTGKHRCVRARACVCVGVDGTLEVEEECVRHLENERIQLRQNPACTSPGSV